MAQIQFRDFSFSRHSPSVHELERAAMNVSPTTVPTKCPPRLPTPPPSVGELANILDQQSLRVEVDPAYRFPGGDEPLTPPSDDSCFPFPPQRPSHCRLSTSILRMQRQSNARKHCSPSHLKDISKLVEKMVERKDQCQVCDTKDTPIPIPTPILLDEDEGVDMDYTPPTPHEHMLYTLKFRRSGDRLNGTTAVSKSVRMRKTSKVTKRSSR